VNLGRIGIVSLARYYRLETLAPIVTRTNRFATYNQLSLIRHTLNHLGSEYAAWQVNSIRGPRPGREIDTSSASRRRLAKGWTQSAPYEVPRYVRRSSSSSVFPCPCTSTKKPKAYGEIFLYNGLRLSDFDRQDNTHRTNDQQLPDRPERAGRPRHPSALLRKQMGTRVSEIGRGQF
jgi:hypothetical protein